MTVVVPTLDKLNKEANRGRRRSTNGLVILRSHFPFYRGISSPVFGELGGGGGAQQIVNDPGSFGSVCDGLTLATGSTFIMWLGEQMTERGIGNILSLLIMAVLLLDCWRRS